MIIPNKSTIAEEDIEVPYGRELRESGGSTAVDDRDRGDTDDGDGGGADSASDYPKSPFGGLSGLSARLRGVDEDDDAVVVGGGGGEPRSAGEDYYDKMSLGRASVASDRSAGVTSRFGNIGGGGSGRGSALGGGGGEEQQQQEKLKRDYEYKIATMQSKIAGLERDLGGKGDRDKKRETKWAEGEERVRVMEEELVGLRKVGGIPIFVYSKDSNCRG
jgi:protein SPA2